MKRLFGVLAAGAVFVIFSPLDSAWAVDCQAIVKESRKIRSPIKKKDFLKKAVGECPDDAVVNYQYGYSLERLRDYTFALKYYEKAHKLDNKEAKYLFGMGDIFTVLGDHQAAIKSYEKGIELSPGSKRAQRSLASVRSQVKSSEAEAVAQKEQVPTANLPDAPEVASVAPAAVKTPETEKPDSRQIVEPVIKAELPIKKKPARQKTQVVAKAAGESRLPKTSAEKPPRKESKKKDSVTVQPSRKSTPVKAPSQTPGRKKQTAPSKRAPSPPEPSPKIAEIVPPLQQVRTDPVVKKKVVRKSRADRHTKQVVLNFRKPYYNTKGMYSLVQQQDKISEFRDRIVEISQRESGPLQMVQVHSDTNSRKLRRVFEERKEALEMNAVIDEEKIEPGQAPLAMFRDVPP
ncbi:hypothetical protein ACFL6N_04160 [Thermodesulfobacteriota bacterium]